MSNMQRKLKRNKKENSQYIKFSKEEHLVAALPEYHHYVFNNILKNNQSYMQSLANKMKKEHSDYFKDKRVENLSEQDLWDMIYKYTIELEKKLESLISEHSVSFWLQLYRRIGLGIISYRNSNTDSSTLYHMRSIVESSIAKFGKICANDIISQDMKRDPQLKKINDTTILGGLFKKNYQDVLKDKYDDIKRVILGKNSQYLGSFSEQDYLNMYYIEQLGYEYWWATAALRAIGKGSSCYLDDEGIVREKRTSQLEKLIQNYDKRITQGDFSTANIGVGFYEQTNKMNILAPVYNIKHVPLSKCSFIESDTVSNFVWATINIQSYIETHALFDKKVREKHGFSIAEIALYLSALSYHFFMNTSKKLIPLLSLYQRAYLIHDNLENLEKMSLQMMQNLAKKMSIKPETLTIENVKKITNFLTLSKLEQKKISLWTYGPNYVFIPSDNFILVDLVNSVKVLENLFFGIRIGDEKGDVFENNYRAFIQNSNLDLLKERRIENFDDKEREIDAAVRVKDTLYLIECRALERPLNYEIGNIDTLSTRKKELLIKLEQAETLAEFIKKNPKGKNYDFSWAKQIVPIMVTPFVEWIWSDDNKFWLTDDIPRILSPKESLQIMKQNIY